MSKIISILVEEALSIRGLYNKKIGKLTHLHNESLIDYKDLLDDSIDFKDNDKFTINSKLRSERNSDNSNFSKQIKLDSFDLETYKKFISFLKFQQMMDEFND